MYDSRHLSAAIQRMELELAAVSARLQQEQEVRQGLEIQVEALLQQKESALAAAAYAQKVFVDCNNIC